MTDAKARLSVYGEPKVIFSLARFEEAGVVLDNPRSQAAFVALANAMRAGNVESRDLMLVLFGASKGVVARGRRWQILIPMLTLTIFPKMRTECACVRAARAVRSA